MTDGQIRQQAILNLACSKSGLSIETPPLLVTPKGEIVLWHNDDLSIRPTEEEIAAEIERISNA